MKNTQFASIDEIIEAYQKGEMVILIDDENRENEGDLLAPASLISAEQINFMAKYARGLICLTLTEERCEKLNLPLMIRSANDQGGTNFTVSIEATQGVTTGISAEDRSMTIQAATNINATADDLTCPGHVFPVRARDGGVLVRAGHTEAGCDLARLAGMPVEASVIVEIMKENGEMARVEDLQEFSQQHNIKLGTIESLIRYRLEKECLMELVAQQKQQLPNGSSYQLMTYWDSVDLLHHYAIVFGDIKRLGNESKDNITWVRVHLQHYLNDLFGYINPVENKDENRSWRLSEAIDFIAQQEGAGVVVLLNQHANEKSPQNHDSKISFDNKNYGKGAQILNLLGVNRMAVLGSHSSYSGISGFGLEVTHFLTKDEHDKNEK